MDSKTRRTTIAERLRVEGEVSIAGLAKQFGTSEMTIRRDLDLFESKGVARRARGGAISIQRRSFEPPILQRSSHMAEAKRSIGAAAAALLHDNETVVLDVGTTTLEMARAIDPEINLTIITSSLLIATELSAKPLVKTLMTGGLLRPIEMSLVGARAEESLEDLNCDITFLGVAGVSDTKGISEYNMDDAKVKRAAIASGRRVVVLADASKIGHIAFVSVASIREVDLLVTNAAPDNPVIRSIKRLGVEIMHVEPVQRENV
jgi:DeoR/GlpR family transcriptional regulator of sugar metabolism